MEWAARPPPPRWRWCAPTELAKTRQVLGSGGFDVCRKRPSHEVGEFMPHPTERTSGRAALLQDAREGDPPLPAGEAAPTRATVAQPGRRRAMPCDVVRPMQHSEHMREADFA